MTVTEAVARTTGAPSTQATLVRDLRALGLQSGQTVLVHSSLSQLGWVVGGAPTVVLALEESVGPEGTLMMPAFSDGIPEPSRWRDPAVPPSWWPTIRNEPPPWDPGLYATWHVGTIAELFRHQPGTLQSFHPNKSFAARGPRAHELLDDQSLDDGFGETSPLGHLYHWKGSILFLGVGHGNNTSMHFAEYRAKYPGHQDRINFRGRVAREGHVIEVAFSDIDNSDADFAEIGRDFERETSYVKLGTVGYAEARLMPMVPLVDYAVQWMSSHRGRPTT